MSKLEKGLELVEITIISFLMGQWVLWNDNLINIQKKLDKKGFKSYKKTCITVL